MARIWFVTGTTYGIVIPLAYSNGPVEAQVQKLKLVKRSMFGRARLPLLKQRLLHTI
jgi:transposase